MTFIEGGRRFQCSFCSCINDGMLWRLSWWGRLASSLFSLVRWMGKEGTREDMGYWKDGKEIS